MEKLLRKARFRMFGRGCGVGRMTCAISVIVTEERKSWIFKEERFASEQYNVSSHGQ